jgi:hypothetical protein
MFKETVLNYDVEDLKNPLKLTDFSVETDNG